MGTIILFAMLTGAWLAFSVMGVIGAIGLLRELRGKK